MVAFDIASDTHMIRYLRFQGYVPNLGTASRLGIFQLAFELRDSNDLPTFAQSELEQHLNWLRINLHSPAILDDISHYRAICWFKPAAHEPLAHIWSIKAILEDYGRPIDVVKTSTPGIIVYQDGWQVAAKPFRATRRADTARQRTRQR